MSEVVEENEGEKPDIDFIRNNFKETIQEINETLEKFDIAKYQEAMEKLHSLVDDLQETLELSYVD